MADFTKDPELAASFEPPTVICNRFYVVTGPGGSRLAFGEAGLDQAVRYRTALQLSLEDAEALGKLLLEQVATTKGARGPSPDPIAGGGKPN